MKVEWLPLARQDREWQLSYLGERDPWAAIIFDTGACNLKSEVVLYTEVVL